MSSWSIIIAIFTLFVCIATTSPTTHSQDIVSRILKNVNSSADPCNNFYEFACGNYAKSVSFIEGVRSMGPLYHSVLEVASRLKQIIEDIDESKAPKPFADMKSAYKYCLKANLSTHGSGSASDEDVDFYHQKFLGRWLSNFRFGPNATAELDYSTLGNDLLRLSRITGSSVWLRGTLILSLVDQPIASSYLREGMSNEVVQNYLMYLEDVFTHMGVNDSQLKAYVRDIVSFEIEVAKIQYPENESYDSHHLFVLMKIKELHDLFPEFFWLYYDDLPPYIRIAPLMNVNVIKKFKKLIMATSNRTLADWTLSRWINKNLDTLGAYVQKKNEMLKSSTYGSIGTVPRWRRCLSIVVAANSLALDVLYYGQYISDSDVKHAEEIFANSKQQFKKLIQKADWLIASTKQQVLEKVDRLSTDIGCFDTFMLDKTSVLSTINPKLSGGLLATNRANVTRILQLFRMTDSSFSTTDASYWKSSNYIQFGAAAFTDAYYNAGQPEALNYGGFGAIASHEMAHSLDGKGRFLDQRHHYSSWWDSESNETYVQRTKCFVEQYKKYAFDEFGLHLQSFKTRDEDISDNVGLKVAYLAYDELTKDKKPEQQLPGLNYTPYYSPKQLFWIGYANNWCSKYRPETERILIYEETHSPEKFRVNIPVSNMPEFANDFNCPLGSKMNPIEKCTLW